MEVRGSEVKERIIGSAITLFNTRGYQGTTIREIARHAGVNSANISYYFHGKQGLLEACLTRFFEEYLLGLSHESCKQGKEQPVLSLKKAVKNILEYQSKNHLLTRLVWREVTLDSQVSREIISTYLMKERYLFKEMLIDIQRKSKHAPPMAVLIIQLKGMLMMPYLNSQYVREVWGMLPNEPFFVEKYYKALEIWIDKSVGLNGRDDGQSQEASILLHTI